MADRKDIECETLLPLNEWPYAIKCTNIGARYDEEGVRRCLACLPLEDHQK
jgi:hypothetical protein